MIWLVFWLICLADHGSFESNDLWWPYMCDPGRLTITRYRKITKPDLGMSERIDQLNLNLNDLYDFYDFMI